MKGLLLKDLYMMAKYCKAWVLILAVMMGASAFSERPTLFLMYPVMLAGLTAVTLIAYDERSGWTTLSRAMPYSKAQLVSVKYIVTLLLLAMAAVLAAVVQLVRAGMGAANAGSMGGILGMLLSAGLAMPAVLLPLVFRFGVEKARILYGIVLGLAISCMVFVSMTVQDMPQLVEDGAFAVRALPASAVLFALSWLLSIRLYRPHMR
ncbi:MAG: ABC-2 transporter permease [Acutalibacteraceae bacterium]